MLAMGCLHLRLHQATRQNGLQANHTHCGKRDACDNTPTEGSRLRCYGAAVLVRAEGLRQAVGQAVEANRTNPHRRSPGESTD